MDATCSDTLARDASGPPGIASPFADPSSSPLRKTEIVAPASCAGSRAGDFDGRKDNAGVQRVVGDQLLRGRHGAAENVVVQLDDRKHGGNRKVPGDADRKLTLDGEAVKRAGIKNGARGVKFGGEKMPKGRPVKTQLPLHRFADAPDFVSGHRFAPSGTQRGHLALQFKRLGKGEGEGGIAENLPRPVRVIIRQEPSCDLRDQGFGHFPDST